MLPFYIYVMFKLHAVYDPKNIYFLKQTKYNIDTRGFKSFSYIYMKQNME